MTTQSISLKWIGAGFLLYLLADLAIPYNSSTPLLIISSVGVLLPLFLFLMMNSSIPTLKSFSIYIVFFLSIKLFFLFGPNVANYSDGKTSISYGTYIGQSPNIVNYRLMFLIVAIVLTAAIFVWLDNRLEISRFRTIHDSNVDSENKDKQLVLKFWYTLGAMAIATPFFEGQVKALTNIVSSPDFDSQQINAWYDFKSQGYLEMKDFWFPYGGMIWIQDGLLGLVLRWVLLSTLLVMFFSLFWNKQKIKAYQIAPIIVTIILSINYSIIAIRYVFPLMALIVFVSGSLKNTKTSLLIRSVPLSIAFWMSPEMSVFVVALGLIWVFLVRSNRINGKNNLPIWVWLIPTTSAALLVLLQLINGQLMNTVHLLLNSREILEYGYSPILGFSFEISADFLSLFRLLVISLSLMVLVQALSNLIQHFRTSQITQDDYIQFLVGLFGLFLLQKEMSRGGLTLWISMLLGLAISYTAYSQSAERSHHNIPEIFKKANDSLLTACSLLALAITLFITPVGAGTFTSIVRAPQQIKVLIDDITTNDSRKILFHASWSQENKQKQSELASLFGPYFQEISGDNFYILGDRPDIYRAFGKQPYWAISQYNLSPKSAQEKVLKQIKSRSPKFVLVDRNTGAQYFDSLPSSLRNPIVYRYVIDNYRFVTTLGEIDLYEIGKDGDNFLSWINLFSNKLDVSALPLIVAPPRICGDKDIGHACEPFLKFTLEDLNNLNLEVNCVQGRFDLLSSSSLLTKGTTYWLPLNHVWFWSNACTIPRKSGVTHQIVIGKSSNSLY
jgi:hypothetical protein